MATEVAFGVPQAQLPQSEVARDFEAGVLFQEMEQGPEVSQDVTTFGWL